MDAHKERSEGTVEFGLLFLFTDGDADAIKTLTAIFKIIQGQDKSKERKHNGKAK